MKVLLILVALILPLIIGQSVTTSYQTACYSTCATCSGFPSNCTSCHSTLVLVDGQCILDVRDGLLVNQFFPLTQTANANISTAPLLDTTTFSVGSCSYTQSGSVLSTMTFIVPTNGQPLTLAYGPAVVPPHSYLNIRMVIMQRGWGASDRLDITFNANPTVQVNMGSPVLGQIVCAGVQAYTTTLQYAFTDTSPSFNLVFNANFVNNAASNYGINSLMIRYGNCHPSCSVCFGPFNTNCTSCQGYTLFNAATTTCYGCDTGFYAVNNSCYPCDPSCLTCSGGGSGSCVSCNALFGTLINGTCSLTDTNQNVQFSAFTTNSFNSSDGWTISTAGTGQNVVSQCGIESYLGGYPVATSNSFISRYFNLEPHFGVAIFFNLLIVDSTLATVAANYWIDDTINSLTLSPTSGTNECGTTIPESLTSVSTGFRPHNKSILYFQFRPLISSTSYYGIRNFFVIVQGCAPGCASCNQTNSSICSSCKSNYILENGLCTNCPVGYFNNGSGCNICSSFCLTCIGPLMNQCTSCQSPYLLKGTLCTLQPNYGLHSMYLNSANSPINADNSWFIYPNLQTRGSTTCGGTNIFGSDQVLYKTLVLEKNFTNLPSHTELTLHMNLYQIDDYNNETLTIYYNDVPYTYNPVTYGNNICGNSSTDAVVKVQQTIPHTGNTFKLKLILNQKAKVGINNLMIFLQGCASCNNDFGYKIRAIPRYNRNIANNGIDVWAQFSQGFYNSSPYDTNQFKGALGPMLNVGLNGRLLQNSVPLDFNVLSTYNDIRMFTQPSASSQNQPLNMMATSPAHFTTYPGGAGIPLLNNGASFPLVRYDRLQQGSGTQRAVRNLYNLFYGFTSAILYISICAFFFGFGGAFQQFVMILQIIFYHVFIMTDRMSLTLKVPLSGMQQIQFLNYFTDSVQKSIQNWLLPTGFWCKSPHVFQQYQVDINFVRAIYAIVILILFYIVIYVLMKILFYSCSSRSISLNKNPYINYFRQIYQRPVSYFDQLLRYVFITTIWACLLQFTHLTNSFVPFSGLNAWATIMFFIIAMIYPAALCCYIWRQYVYMTNDQFYYLYNDVMFKRIRRQMPQENPHPFIYIATRFYIYFLILLVIAIPSYRYNPLGSLIPLIIIHAADMIYVICVRIYADPFLLAFKIIENSCLIILEILMLAMYGRGRNMGQSSFYSLGYACVAFIILMFINASVRLIYLIYARVMMFLETKYALDVQVLEQNRMNQAQKQLLRGRTRLFNNQAGQTQIIQQRNMTRRLPTHIVQQQMVQQMHRGSLMEPQPSIGRILY